MFRSHPLVGVGANNYEVAFSEARQKFAATHPDSPLVGMNEQLLTQYAHNEYVQILAELGIVGILIFGAVCLLLARTVLARNPTLTKSIASFGRRWRLAGLCHQFSG